jgi:membrane associated rhomboid family serine protease
MFPLYDLNPHHRFPWLTIMIIAANVAVMAWMSTLGDSEIQRVALQNGFVPRRVSQAGSGKPVVVTLRDVDRRGRIVPVGIAQLSSDPADVYRTFVTTMFLHGGWFHLLSNMWILWIFGNNIEDRLGHFMYVCYYLLGGIVGSLCHYALDPSSDLPVIGASGAVATVLGGYAITYPWAKVRTVVFFGLIMIIDIPALVWLGIWFVLQNVVPAVMVMRGVVQDPVAYWAHIGGFVSGIGLMPLLSLGAPPPDTDWRKEADEMFQYNDPHRRLE